MTSMRTLFGYEDLEGVAKAVYASMEAEAVEADIQPWPRWKWSQAITEAVYGVAWKP